jgi:hypothetical protein
MWYAPSTELIVHPHQSAQRLAAYNIGKRMWFRFGLVPEARRPGGVLGSCGSSYTPIAAHVLDCSLRHIAITQDEQVVGQDT